MRLCSSLTQIGSSFARSSDQYNDMHAEELVVCRRLSSFRTVRRGTIAPEKKMTHYGSAA